MTEVLTFAMKAFEVILQAATTLQQAKEQWAEVDAMVKQMLANNRKPTLAEWDRFREKSQENTDKIDDTTNDLED